MIWVLSAWLISGFLTTFVFSRMYIYKNGVRTKRWLIIMALGPLTIIFGITTLLKCVVAWVTSWAPNIKIRYDFQLNKHKNEIQSVIDDMGIPHLFGTMDGYTGDRYYYLLFSKTDEMMLRLKLPDHIE